MASITAVDDSTSKHQIVAFTPKRAGFEVVEPLSHQRSRFILSPTAS